ncbi:DNA translocase FtsK [Ralstonia pickettii]|nr:DNA translocase FtsK [Ralstonia pickettii]
MWKQLKSKMKNLLQADTTDMNEQEQESRYQRHEIKPKITYQYPENKSFRFPVIPDEPKRGTQAEEKPAYLRREQEKKRETKNKREQEQLHPRKVYKNENAPPFTPTEVPSPIYGFQKRNNSIENVPAYQRKQKGQESVEQEVFNKVFYRSHEQDDDERELQATEAASTVEEAEEEIIEKGNSQVFDFQPTKEKTDIITETAEEKEADTAAEAAGEEKTKIKTIQQIAKEEKENSSLIKRHEEKNQRKLTSRAQKRKKDQTSDLNPYNVMMMPVDKQRLFPQSNPINNKTETVEKPKEREKQQFSQIETREEKQEIPYHLLDDPIPINHENDIWIEEQQSLLEQTLKHFNVAARVVKATQGPSVTRFEVQPEMGVKVSKIRNLSDDLKLNMSAKDIRIEAPIPGKNTVGIEVPNPRAQTVGLQEILETDQFTNNVSPLTIALGLNIEGEPKVTNIQKMPHGLIAGATGSGKSVCINAILLSILYKASHEDVKFLLIDPKMVELAPYNGIPHLVAPVITDVKAATQSLKWAVNEMEERYESFVEEGVRDIERYNRKVVNAGLPEKKMPYLVIVIDELADLMMMSPQDVENSISRIAQKARACGIHLLLATQRPSVDVITGLIKANIPTRIAFSVSSQVDSRTILDASGAEKLLGRGDMLFMENGTGKSVRLQGPFVSDDEIERVTAYAREIAEPEYLFEQEQLLEQVNMDEDEDELLDEAIQFVLHQRSASTSMLQRHFKVGYNRAARLIDSMEARGIISGQNGSKPRDVLVTESMVE